MKPIIRIKRAYEPAENTDGYRVLVDKLWPRGIDKEHAAIEEWAKQLAPSDALRKWFGHDPALWEGFQQQYRAELDQNPDVAEFVHHHKGTKLLTLVYGAKDTLHNNAVVLQSYLETKF